MKTKIEHKKFLRSRVGSYQQFNGPNPMDKTFLGCSRVYQYLLQ